MPSIDRRRRRRRIPRVGAAAAAGAVVGALVVAALVGGALEARSQSTGYERAVDRSYADQARLFGAESDRLGTSLRGLLAAMAGDDRETLEEALDTLVRSTASVAREAATAASPAPSGGAGADVAAAMVDRAEAVRTLRTAVDRLLGMPPLPVVGANGPSALQPVPPPLSPAGAAARLAKVGRLLARGDRMYAAGRRALRAAPGRARLPSSVWPVRRGTWTPSGTRAMVAALTSSAALAPVHEVELLAHALALTPAPVPPSRTGSGTSGLVVPPTGRLAVGVVVANDGNVAERGIAVRAAVTRVGGAARLRKARRVALAAESSASVTLPPIPVVPGDRYTLVVSVDPPLANVRGTVTSDTVSFRVAPPGPPTVLQLSPAKGSERGGTAVTILGTGFTWVRGVDFGTSAARFEVVSSTEITAVAPPGRGTVAVRVENRGGASATSAADRFAYVHERCRTSGTSCT